MQKNKHLHTFSSEIDNMVGVHSVESMLIGPIFDRDGNLKGVIQLINKEGDGIITEQDRIELDSLLPSLGEIIKTADEVREINNVSSGIELYLMKAE